MLVFAVTFFLLVLVRNHHAVSVLPEPPNSLAVQDPPQKTADSADYVREVAEKYLLMLVLMALLRKVRGEQNLGIILIRYLITHLEIYYNRASCNSVN